MHLCGTQENLAWLRVHRSGGSLPAGRGSRSTCRDGGTGGAGVEQRGAQHVSPAEGLRGRPGLRPVNLLWVVPAKGRDHISDGAHAHLRTGDRMEHTGDADLPLICRGRIPSSTSSPPRGHPSAQKRQVPFCSVWPTPATREV